LEAEAALADAIIRRDDAESEWPNQPGRRRAARARQVQELPRIELRPEQQSNSLPGTLKAEQQGPSFARLETPFALSTGKRLSNVLIFTINSNFIFCRQILPQKPYWARLFQR
jgi:hypothetical protein